MGSSARFLCGESFIVTISSPRPESGYGPEAAAWFEHSHRTATY